MGLTLADLMTAESIATIRARLVAGLAADAFPVSSWAPSAAGGVENMRLDFTAGGVGALLPPRIAAFVNGRILPLATDDPLTGNYLTALGFKFYGLTKRQPTFTIQNVGLYTQAPAQPSYAFSPGDLWVKGDATGNRYRSISGGSFSATNVWPNRPLIIPGVDNPLFVQFQAENPGSSYDDVAGTIKTMVTARAGVRCVNIAPADYTPAPAACNGTSTGTVAVTFATPGAAPPFGSVRIAVTATGNVGAGMVKVSTDGGVSWSISFVIPSSVTLVQTPSPVAALLSFANKGSPSFIAGDIFTAFLGDAILQRGSDVETDPAFRRRCSNRWPALSPIPVAATIDLWAHDASDEVDKVSVDGDPNTSGGMLVTIASATGPASPAAQIAVEDYITARLQGYKGVPAPATAGFTSPQETVLVRSAISFSVIANGTVRVPKSQIAGAQVAANVAWNAYLAELPIGGQPGSVVERARLAQILADAGAIDMPTAYSTLTLNLSASDLVTPTGKVAVPAPGTTLLDTITWQPA